MLQVNVFRDGRHCRRRSFRSWPRSNEETPTQPGICLLSRVAVAINVRPIGAGTPSLVPSGYRRGTSRTLTEASGLTERVRGESDVDPTPRRQRSAPAIRPHLSLDAAPHRPSREAHSDSSSSSRLRQSWAIAYERQGLHCSARAVTAPVLASTPSRARARSTRAQP